MRFSKASHGMVLTILAAALTLGMGCSTTPNDNQIVQNVQSQIQKDSAIGGSVNVESAGGVVTLNGQVPNDSARLIAGRDAAAVPGVKVVVNNLTVTPPVAAAAVAPPPVPQEKPAVKEPPKRVAQSRPRNKEAAVRTPPPEPVPQYTPPPAPPPAPVAVEPFPPPPPPPPSKYTIPAGTVLSVRLIDSLDSSKNRVGDTFRASLDSPIRTEGEVTIPAGLDIEGRVVEASNAGKYTGHPELGLELTKLTARGEIYPLRTDEYNRSAGGRGKGTAETVGAGAGLGAIIGGIAGGGRGAAIGAVAGAGAGGVARTAQKAPKISFPTETVLTFRLQEPLTVPASIAGAKGPDRYSEPSRPELKRRGGNSD